jgi:predicted nucleotidyltransferase
MVKEETLQVIDKIPDAQYIVEKLRGVLTGYRKEIKFAFLFGSYASGEADNWSDIDIGIYFANGVTDEIKNEIRFKIEDVLHPLESHIGYLEDGYTPSVVFVEAASGIPIVMNDEDIYFKELLKNIHITEEMKLIGILEKD